METREKCFVLIGALDAEIDEYLRHLQQAQVRQWKEFTFYEGFLSGKMVVVCKSGVGKVFAAMITQKLIDVYNPAAVIFTGVAGSISPEIEVGDIVVASDCIQHDLNASELGFPRGSVPYTDYRFLPTDARLRELALSAPCLHIVHEGRILTGDHFLTQSEMENHRYLREELEGDAVEMEGAAAGQVCTVNEIPYLLIRTISDKADEKAAHSFSEMLPQIAGNSFSIVSHVLKML
jgi:5'-methylthioadenosine/S-adenosylhomocysteine nucleosidase